MLPRMKKVTPLPDYCLHIEFDDGRAVVYDVKDDISTLPGYDALKNVFGLFQQVQMDASRTCIFWTEDIDLPSDTLYEYGLIQ